MGSMRETSAGKPPESITPYTRFDSNSEAQCFFLSVDAVLAAPQFAACGSDGEVEAVAVKEFAELVGGLGVPDLLDSEQKGTFSGGIFS